MRAARIAGLPGRISLMTESEAAAIAVCNNVAGGRILALEIGDCFVVCDAGKVTVDLISYKITALDPLRIEECVGVTSEFLEGHFTSANIHRACRWPVRLIIS